MKALTIKEPYASLIVNGYKEYEFRSWKTKYRGPFLIHASLTSDKKDFKRFINYNLDYNPGYIIGSAEITDCIFIDDKKYQELLTKDSEVYKNCLGSYAFVLKNIKKFKKPIKAKGKLSFWNYGGDINESK